MEEPIQSLVRVSPREYIDQTILLSEHPEPEICPVTLYLLNDLTTSVSRKGMLSNLRRATRVLTQGVMDDPFMVKWEAVSQPYVARMRTMLLEQGFSPATTNVTLAAVCGVLREAWRLGKIDSDQLLRATDVKPAHGSRINKKGRLLSPFEIRALFEACLADKSPAGVRDAALFSLAIGAGLRRDELCHSRVDDYRLETEVPGFSCLFIRGKGNKERSVYIHNGAREAMGDWLTLRGSDPGNIFLPVSGTGEIGLRTSRITGQAIAKIFAKRGEQAGVAAFSPHDCRRTYVSTLLDNGVDIGTAAKLAGHASVNTTRIYDRRGDRAAISAAGSLHIPYKSVRE
jgi:integrase